VTAIPRRTPRFDAAPLRINLLAGAAGSASIIFIPLYARAYGATNDEIGFIVAAFSGFALFASFVFGRAADVHGLRRVLRAGLLLSAGAAAIQIAARDPLTIGLSRAFLGFASGMFPAALFAYAKTGDRLIGRFAAFGSLGWAVGTLAAGAVESAFRGVIWPVFALSSALYVAGFFLAGSSPQEPVRVPIPFLPVAVFRKNLAIYASMLIRHTGANMIWVIFTLYLIDIGRMSGLEVGIVYTVNPLVQFVVMQRTDRVRGGTLVAAGLGLSALTFLTFAVSANFWWLLGTQVLLGVSFAVLYTGALRDLAERNQETATAGALLGSVMSFAAILGPIAGGILSSTQADLRASYVLPMLVASGMSFAALLVYLWTRPRPEPRTRAPAARSADSTIGPGGSS